MHVRVGPEHPGESPSLLRPLRSAQLIALYSGLQESPVSAPTPFLILLAQRNRKLSLGRLSDCLVFMSTCDRASAMLGGEMKTPGHI